MNRDIEVNEAGMPRALFRLRYENRTGGQATITLYSSKMEGERVITVPLLQYITAFDHNDLHTLEQVRSFDEAFVKQELGKHAGHEQEQPGQIGYDHEPIRGRYCIRANDKIIGLAVLIDHFSENHSTLHYLSCERMSEDQVLSGDRFSFLPADLLAKLSQGQREVFSLSAVL